MSLTPQSPPPPDHASLLAENDELRLRLREMEETLEAIYGGDVDALVVNNDVFLLESAGIAGNRLRHDVLGQMLDSVFAFDNEDHLIFLNPVAELRYGLDGSDALGRSKASLFTEVPHGDELPHPTLSEGALSGESAAQRAHLSGTHVLIDGRSMDVEMTRSELVDAEGAIFGSLFVVRDVTQSRRAALRRNALAQFSESLRDLDMALDVGDRAAETIGRTLKVGRVGFCNVDLDAETVMLTRQWVSSGMVRLYGTVKVRDYGSTFDDLKRNRVVCISDVCADPRTAPARDALLAVGVRSLVNMPVCVDGKLLSYLYVNDSKVRQWAKDDLEFMQEIADRARAAMERVINAAALRASEQRLREVNESLEATVLERSRELLSAQEALRQAQKMEAVGQLTGGIAHDFNNLLAGMSVSMEVLQRRLRKGQFEDNERYLEMSLDGIKRAAALTQRLLAFARRQTLDPKSLDVNRLVAGMQELIQRSIGPNIILDVLRSDDLWTAKIDASQTENALLNLCINARDAMSPRGGHLTIETANVEFDSRAAAQRDLAAGEYVALSVTDTGVGIPREVINRIFDPFYTTKPTGRGTGLGLSMVYGFVRQSGGQVWVQSEIGAGTTMRLYFPRHRGAADAVVQPQRPTEMQNGNGKRIVVIEDEGTIRTVIAELLREAGYAVITAEDGPSGLRILQGPGPVDVLVTDVGLPGGLNGRQVADAARESRPDLKVLFITGYAENAAVGNGLLEPGMQVLTKPFDISVLAEKVKEMSGG